MNTKQAGSTSLEDKVKPALYAVLLNVEKETDGIQDRYPGKTLFVFSLSINICHKTNGD